MNPISPIDGRYSEKVEELSAYFSDFSLTRYRVFTELKFLEKFLRVIEKKETFPIFTITEDDFDIIKQIETKGYKNIPATNHDGKAIEYFIKSKVDEKIREFVHFGLTTEDITNLAYGIILRESINNIMLPKMKEISIELGRMAENFKKEIIIGRTHGQTANLTSFGHQFRIFKSRIDKEMQELEKTKIYGKLNGSVGTLASFKFAYPEIDWILFSDEFIKSLGLTPEKYTTQVLPGENYSRIFDCFTRYNSILISLSQDFWRYISDGWLVLKIKKGEIGSSVMPQKVNPIDFENAEGNLKIANMLFSGFSAELPVSRLQRDLSDSTIKRNFGVAFSHSLIGYKSIQTGLSKISPNSKLISVLIQKHPEVLAEAYQTELRKYIPNSYELIKSLTRGKEISLKELHDFIDNLNIPIEAKEKLKSLKIEEYIGYCHELSSQR